MSVSKTFLGLLEGGASYGYDLKREYDTYFGADKPVAYGQVYATLARLLKGGLVTVEAVEPGEGPDRKRYAITEAGVADVNRWLAEPERPELYLQSTLYAKVVLALRTGRAAESVLEAQQAEHLKAMRELTRRKLAGDLADQLLCDHALFHLEADMRWLELTAARLDALAGEMRSSHPADMRADAARGRGDRAAVGVDIGAASAADAASHKPETAA